MTKIAFLDRDGTLNIEKDYLYKWSDFEWIAGAKDFLLSLKKKNYIIAVITNQSGIARDYYQLRDVHMLHEKMNDDLFETHGIKIDHFEICPHHPDFSGKCECRKPGIKMFSNIESKEISID